MKIKFLTIALLITACQRADLEVTQKPDIYQMNIDKFTLDTIPIGTTVWWRDTVTRIEEKRKLDTIKPRWWRICDANLQPTHLEYHYYLKNGFKLQ